MAVLREIIRNEVEKSGAISFARFMELALYCPVYGFYEQEPDNIGRRGHYYTSVSTGSLFGELLAFQFADWLAALPAAPKYQLVEAGVHDGRLAADILGWLTVWRPDLFERVEYWIVEPSARRREWQRKTLERFGTRVRWAESLEQDVRAVVGIIFSNEFLDSLPVRRFGWDAARRAWFEWGVAYRDGRFVWTRLQSTENAPRALFELPSEFLDALPDGYTVETCPMAERWWRAAAHALAAGRLVAIDYGLTADERFDPARTRGTVRAYRRHQVFEDVLADPGQQDITAHVDFAALQVVGEAVGLKTEGLVTQGQFLTRVAERALQSGIAWCNWSDAQKRQFKTLVHPNHLGRVFRVFIQARLP
ncbi:MAG: SAM-dependent methyltransferase [Verrucomicrobiae bacterium]|nr:SAM-dependent methyltransferase [Verrucomicrobiae bacterium]MCX7722990.1 SAM-dependent methyltransferase [Verrucomicrobiae bacterium]MDW7980757.1 SAM-dependent methyltransferase [Verrucomicrobiales bacterium]